MKKAFLSIFMCFMASLIVAANGQVKRVAITEVVDSQSNVDPGLKLAVRSSLTTGINLVENYEAYERVNISAMFKELDFQRSGYISNEQIHKIGDMTGASFILIPELARLFDDGKYVLTARIIDVVTGLVTESAETYIQKNLESVQNGARELAMKLLGVSRGGSSSATGMAQGRTLSVDGGKYKGEIFDGKPNGKGIIYYPESDKRLSLEGTFVNGDIRRGIMIFRNGNTYEGEFANGTRNGYGVYKYSDGRRCEGYWKDGVQFGTGKYFWTNGDTFEGTYANDKRNGYGVYKYSNGDRYEGYWKDGSRHGEGVYIYSNGKKEKCHYRNGTPEE